MFATRSFKPTLVPTVAAIVGVALTAMLGDWQLNRAAHKAELGERIREAAHLPAAQVSDATVDNASVLYHNVEAHGEFDAERTVYIDNRVYQGVAGYEVASPLKIAGTSRYVLVLRGWVASGRERSQLPAVITPKGQIRVAGIAVPGNPALFELSQQVLAGKLWQNLTVDRYRSRFGLDLQPIMIQQRNDLADGLTREWPAPSLGIERHRAYALQWFSMALAILILYVVLNVKRNPPRA